MAQSIVVMRQGVIQQVGSPREIYKRPANTFVARFIGSPPMNLLPFGEDGRLLGCRPEDVSLSPVAEPSFDLPARITSLQPLGPALLIECALDQGEARVAILAPWRGDELKVGQPLTLYLPKSACLWFDEASGGLVAPQGADSINPACEDCCDTGTAEKSWPGLS